MRCPLFARVAVSLLLGFHMPAAQAPNVSDCACGCKECGAMNHEIGVCKGCAASKKMGRSMMPQPPAGVMSSDRNPAGLAHRFSR